MILILLPAITNDEEERSKPPSQLSTNHIILKRHINKSHNEIGEKFNKNNHSIPMFMFDCAGRWRASTFWVSKNSRFRNLETFWTRQILFRFVCFFLRPPSNDFTNSARSSNNATNYYFKFILTNNDQRFKHWQERTYRWHANVERNWSIQHL